MSELALFPGPEWRFVLDPGLLMTGLGLPGTTRMYRSKVLTILQRSVTNLPEPSESMLHCSAWLPGTTERGGCTRSSGAGRVRSITGGSPWYGSGCPPPCLAQCTPPHWHRDHSGPLLGPLLAPFWTLFPLFWLTFPWFYDIFRDFLRNSLLFHEIS